jgi:hypothetical protein
LQYVEAAVSRCRWADRPGAPTVSSGATVVPIVVVAIDWCVEVVRVAPTVLFVCPHGAGKSRIAAAWFNADPPAGWAATTAGVQPQSSVSLHAPRLLAGTPAAAFLDRDLPRPVHAVPDRSVVVAIDCPTPPVPDALRWTLTHDGFDAAMADELRAAVRQLSLELAADGVIEERRDE